MTLNRQVAKMSQVLLQYKMFSVLVEHDVRLKWPGCQVTREKEEEEFTMYNICSLVSFYMKEEIREQINRNATHSYKYIRINKYIYI